MALLPITRKINGHSYRLYHQNKNVDSVHFIKLKSVKFVRGVMVIWRLGIYASREGGSTLATLG